MLDKIKKQMAKLGYTKQKQKTKAILLVYVPKAERDIHLDKIAKATKGTIDKSPKILRSVSSAGAVQIGNYYVGVKPDLSVGLKTDEQETLAGIFIATRLANPRTDYSLAELRKHGDKFTDSAYKIDSLYEKSGKVWLDSSRVIADKVATYTSGAYRVQQRSRSKFEANISNAAKKLIKEAGHKMGLDKWNPADIWLVRPSMVNTDFSKFKSIHSLNEFLLEQHKKKTIIGVSLKMVKKTAKLEVFNTGVREKKNFEGFDLGKSFSNSINATLYFTGGSVVIRSFGRPESVSAEINGKFAQGGKAGSGPLFNIIERIDRRFKTQDHKQISTVFNSKPEVLIKHLHSQMEKLQPENISYDDFKDKVMAKSNALTYVISKYQACDVIESVQRMNKNQREELIDAILSYASSSTKISSIFLKVS